MIRPLLALSLASLAACADADLADPSALAVEQAAVPAGLPAFVVGELYQGSSVTMTWADLPPKSPVYFFVSSATGTGPCHPALQGQCLDIDEPVTMVGSGRSNRRGFASITVRVPAGVPDGTYFWQAAALPAGMDPILSDVFERGTGPGICPFIFNPVCGVDGNTYDNDCIATAFGVAVDDYGFCP